MSRGDAAEVLSEWGKRASAAWNDRATDASAAGFPACAAILNVVLGSNDGHDNDPGGKTRPPELLCALEQAVLIGAVRQTTAHWQALPEIPAWLTLVDDGFGAKMQASSLSAGGPPALHFGRPSVVVLDSTTQGTEV